MKTHFHNHDRPRAIIRLVTFSAIAILLASCASQATAPNPAAAVRTRLTILQSDSELASRAPIEIKDAEVAVVAAEQKTKDAALSQHLLLIAGQKIDIAAAWAQSRLYEDQREALGAESDTARLEARTREADRARLDASDARDQTQIARNDASVARSATATAQNQATVARNATAVAQSQAAIARQDTQIARAETDELQRQLSEIEAVATDRGQVVTLGDVMFETGKAELRGGTPANLDRLALFLKRYDNRTVRIEGFTDNVGTEGANLSLSQMRADAVRSYLEDQGVTRSRMSVSGLGERNPVASNDADTGRQQNRRVEVIISNAL